MLSNDNLKEYVGKLLRTLCEPTTPTTTQEVYCRLFAFDLDVVLPILSHELDSEPDVVRLVLGVLIEISHHSHESIRSLFPKFIACLEHEDRLVRAAAVQFVRETRLDDRAILDSLRRRIIEDEPIIQREAALTLIELDDSLVEKLPKIFCEV